MTTGGVWDDTVWDTQAWDNTVWDLGVPDVIVIIPNDGGSDNGNTGTPLTNPVAVTEGTSFPTRLYCQVCDIRVHKNDMLQRWDGLWVGRECFEPRHILDFYKMPDTETMPATFVSPDPSNGATWAPISNLMVNGTGTTQILATYIDTGTSVTVSITIINPAGNSTTSTLGVSTINLPTNISVSGSGTALDSQGKLLGTFVIDSTTATIRLPAWTNVTNTITLTGTYTK